MTTPRSSSTTAERTVLAILGVAALVAAVWIGLMALTIGSWALSG
ncbi:morphogenic membrane protein MmpA [Streptomyces sp. NBC_01465]|nr:hypothetical protein [Streptomyces sp. NBC_01465]